MWVHRAKAVMEGQEANDLRKPISLTFGISPEDIEEEQAAVPDEDNLIRLYQQMHLVSSDQKKAKKQLEEARGPRLMKWKTLGDKESVGSLAFRAKRL